MNAPQIFSTARFPLSAAHISLKHIFQYHLPLKLGMIFVPNIFFISQSVLIAPSLSPAVHQDNSSILL
jgi:hypothetical protein